MPTLTIPEQLADILDQIDRSGSFCASGTLEIHSPRLEVEGVGLVALPFLPMQAPKLIAVAEQAPYGKGTETLTDTKVRNTWQIGAERVRITGKGWQADLDTIVKQAAAGLGVEGKVKAELYKVLVYEPGSFFVSHRDSEKAPGMFATLVIVLPSDYQGGELIIRHQGEQVNLKLHCDEPAEVAFAAFYADCVHEVRPITAGYRLTLIYNLLRPAHKGEPLPVAPNNTDAQLELTDLLHTWSSSNAPPDKIIYPLEHAYTEAEINFATLKGNDVPRGEVLVAAAAASDCQALLALLTISESGYAEYADYRRTGQEFEIGEVTDSERTLSNWRLPNGTNFDLGALPFEDAEIAPPSALNDVEDAENIEFNEATGNAGASFDRLYTIAALVVWPYNRRLAVIAKVGIKPTITLLGNLIASWRNDGAKPDTAQHKEILQLVAIIQNQWSNQVEYRHQYKTYLDSTTFLEHLLALGNVVEIDSFLSLRTATGIYTEQDNAILVECLRSLPVLRSGEILQAIIKHNSVKYLSACANLLQLLAKAHVCPGALPAALTVLIDAASKSLQIKDLSPPNEIDITLITALLPACELIDPARAIQMLDQFIGQSNDFVILLQAALRLHSNATTRAFPSVRKLCDTVLTHLRQRVEKMPSPPEDWSRDNTLTCKCVTCVELAQFLTNPTTKVWQYRAAQHKRSHVENVIEKSRSDVDCTTTKNGSPHTLVCTKNTASYQRRVAQYHLNLQHVAMLES